MKSLKGIYYLLVKELIVIAICAFIGVVALGVVSFIPNYYMYDNTIEASTFLYNKGLGAHIWEGVGESMLDIFTDGLMLNTAYTETKDKIRDVLLCTRVHVDELDPMSALYEAVVLSNDNYVTITYGKYWHGYQIILRPLLCVFTYSDIYQINMIFQLALVFTFTYLLAKSEERKLIIPFFGMYIFLSPISLFSCLQYSACFYIMMFALIALIALKKYLNDATRNYLFLLTGISTAYFDLLTFPLITLGVPLIAYLGMECMQGTRLTAAICKSGGGQKKGCLFLVYTASWCIGYAGMWASKWIIATILTDENVIYNAFLSIRNRSDFSREYSYIETLKRNIGFCNKRIYFVALICLAVLLIILKIKKYNIIDKTLLPCTCVLLFASIYPFIWYFFTENHSSIHYWFTYRELAISVFGILMICVINVKRGNVL